MTGQSALAAALVPQRAVVVGTSGAGKSTFSRKLASILDVPVIELDGFKHGPCWQRVDAVRLCANVLQAVAQERWVVDGNWDEAPNFLWPQADTVVWLDYPRFLVTWRVLRRSVSRTVLRRRLWNDNYETVRDWFEGTHPLYVALRTFGPRRRAYSAEMDGRWVRLASPSQAGHWLSAPLRGSIASVSVAPLNYLSADE